MSDKGTEQVAGAGDEVGGNDVPKDVATPPDFASLTSGLPEDLKEYLAKGQYKDLAGVVNTARSAEQKLGRPSDRMVYLPSDVDDDYEEGMGQLYNRLGRPEQADGYELPEMEGYTLNEDQRATLGEVAHKYGVSQEALAGLVKEAMEPIIITVDEARAAQLDLNSQKCEAALRREWGAAFDDRLAAVTDMVQEFSPEFREWIDEREIGSQPEFVDMIWKWAKATKEPDDLPGARPGSGDLNLAPAEAQLAASDYYNKYKEALEDGGHPDHNIHLDRWLGLKKKQEESKAAAMRGFVGA